MSKDLSPREKDILGCVAEGNANKQIGYILGISEQVVKNHMVSIMKKMGANDRTHAAVMAIRQGIID